jgi:hypothetical protein
VLQLTGTLSNSVPSMSCDTWEELGEANKVAPTKKSINRSSIFRLLAMVLVLLGTGGAKWCFAHATIHSTAIVMDSKWFAYLGAASEGCR